MKKTLALLAQGFESSSQVTQEFKVFTKVFKNEMTKELKKLGATDIKVGTGGHFCLSGFFKVDEQWFYLSLSDVRDSEYLISQGRPIELLYRTAQHDKDFTGGGNQYVNIEPNMFGNMRVY